MQRPPPLKSLRRRIGRIRDAILQGLLARKAERRLKRSEGGQPHGLPGELILSLTSYPARFRTLHLTLACLLDQSVKPDRVILWIARGDMSKLPVLVLDLRSRGLELRACDDLRSFKKLVPALEAFPDAFIATADDDVYYSRDWLEALVDGAKESVITCHRAHRIKRTAVGMAPYLDWEFDVQDDASRRPSSDLLPTGVGGMLYPPNSLDSRVTNRDQFLRLCPDGDDLWFYWCARTIGTRHKKVGGKMRLVAWPGSQDSSLWDYNEAGGNDRMIAALEREFGSIDAGQE